METIFQLSNTLVLPFWLLMTLLPHWRWTKRIMSSLWVFVPWLLAYSILVVPNLLSLAGELADPSIEGIAALLGTPLGATLGWIHFIAFDLFVGRWIYLDSREHGFSAWLISPILAITLLFGPLGMLLYLAVRAVLPRRTA
jgi:hypothetical protein